MMCRHRPNSLAGILSLKYSDLSARLLAELVVLLQPLSVKVFSVEVLLRISLTTDYVSFRKIIDVECILIIVLFISHFRLV